MGNVYHIVEVPRDDWTDTPSNESDEEFENTLDVEEIRRENKLSIPKSNDFRESKNMRWSRLQDEVDRWASLPVTNNNHTIEFESKIPRLLEPI